MYKKEKPIINKKFLEEVRRQPCCVCGTTYWVCAHHHIRKSRVRLDIDENCSSICYEHHMMWHSSPDQFRRLHGEEMYDFLGELKNDMTLSEVYEKYGE